MTQNLKKFYNFISSQPLAVLATVGCAESHSALIAFSQNKDLEIYFMTFVDSRKYADLIQNSFVSLVIGFNYITVQYEGLAYLLSEKGSKEAFEAFSFKETPCSLDYLKNPRTRFFKVQPKWIRYSDYTMFPAEILEYFFS